MRIETKSKSENYTDSNGTKYKKLTTTKTTKITIGDVIGVASVSKDAISALKKKGAEVANAFAGTAAQMLIAPFIAFATIVDVIKKTITVAAVATPIITAMARTTGIIFSPGNVAELIKMGISAVSVVLIALATGAMTALKSFIWNYEIDLGNVSNVTLIKLSDKITKNGQAINSKIKSSLGNLKNLASTKGNFFSKNGFENFNNDINLSTTPLIKTNLIDKINSDGFPVNPLVVGTELFGIIELTSNMNLFGIPGKNEDFGIPSLSNEISPLRTIVANESIYKIHKLDSIIDWENDVNMQPIFPVTINDLINYSNPEIYPIYNYNNIEITNNYAALIKETKTYLNNMLKIMQSNMGNSIDSAQIDISDLLPDVETKDKKAFIDLANSFDVSSKIISKKLANEYLENIINLSESQTKELISMGLYESEILYRGMLNNFLFTLNEGITNGTLTKAECIARTNSITFSYDFSMGLQIAFYNYLNALSQNTNILNESNDKNLINLASEFYKTERSKLIKDIKSRVKNIAPYKNHKDISFNYLNNSVSLIEDLGDYLAISSWSNKTELKVLIANFIKDYDLTVSSIMDFTTIINNIIDSTKNGLYSELNLVKKDLSFTTFESFTDSFPASMSINDKLKTYKYLEEIHNKLLFRINELMILSCGHIGDYINDNLASIIISEIMFSGGSTKEEIIYNANLFVDSITNETGPQQISKIINGLSNMNFITPSMKILNNRIFYFINNIKLDFDQNVGVL